MDDTRRPSIPTSDDAPVNVMRRTWGSTDAIALIFAGSAAEFAVNRAVDWLFWTNALPNAPIERFFETVRFAQAIAFGSPNEVQQAIDAVNRAHAGVERSRGRSIPAWSYRDVLFMLIDYGERAYETVYGSMTPHERETSFAWSVELGRALHIADLPTTYADYRVQRREHLAHNIVRSEWTDRLYRSYREHLGAWRYRALLDVQGSLVPPEVATVLSLSRKRRVDLLLRSYQHMPRERLLRVFGSAFLPRRYAAQFAALERPLA